MVLLSHYGSAARHARFEVDFFARRLGLWPPTNEDGERTGNFSKPAALRGLKAAFDLTLTTPSGVRSTPFTTGRGAPLPKLRA